MTLPLAVVAFLMAIVLSVHATKLDSPKSELSMVLVIVLMWISFTTIAQSCEEQQKEKQHVEYRVHPYA